MHAAVLESSIGHVDLKDVLVDDNYQKSFVHLRETLPRVFSLRNEYVQVP